MDTWESGMSKGWDPVWHQDRDSHAGIVAGDDNENVLGDGSPSSNPLEYSMLSLIATMRSMLWHHLGSLFTVCLWRRVDQ